MLKIKRFLKLFPVFLALALNLEATIFDQSLDFKEGVVHYQLSTHGSKTLYVKEHGKKRVIFTNHTNNLLNHTKQKITYITPRWIYELNLDLNITTKVTNINYLLNEKFKKLTKKEQRKVEKNLHKQKSTKKILGYECNLESIDGVTTYKAVGMDLVLKSDIDILGFHKSTIATKIEKKEVDDKLFSMFKKLDIKEDIKKSKELERKATKIITSLLKPHTNIKHITERKNDFQQILQDTTKKLDKL